MQTIIVTGGAGFIGTNFVHYLLAKTRGRRVVVFDKLTYAGNLLSLKGALRDPRVRFIQGDIADGPGVERLFRVQKPSMVFNLAAESHVDRSIDGPGEFIRTNLTGTFHMLETARRYHGGLTPAARNDFRFLHVSTDEVYGSLGKRGLFTERTPYAPNSPYAATKAGADHLVRAYHKTYGLPALLTNCSNNYGPYQFPEKLIPLFVLNALEGKPLPLYGRGGNTRDWLFVEDHCEALWTVATRGKPGEKYNIGGNKPLTNVQVAGAICRQLEKALPASGNRKLRDAGVKGYSRLLTFVQDRPGHDLRYAIDASKVRKELGWRPRHDFESGLATTVRWYLDNLDWCEGVQSGKYGRQRLGLSKGRP